tara:strand:+ start:310 stop:612 length:303 start_codon:yes stop_codon:yes gene_type:complete
MDIFGTIGSFVQDNANMIAGGAATTSVLWILKQIPNEQIKVRVHDGCVTLGRALTLGMTKWSVTKKVWNKTIEPYFIDLVDNVVGSAVQGFIKGLRSDNK